MINKTEGVKLKIVRSMIEALGPSLDKETIYKNIMQILMDSNIGIINGALIEKSDNDEIKVIKMSTDSNLELDCIFNEYNQCGIFNNLKYIFIPNIVSSKELLTKYKSPCVSFYCFPILQSNNKVTGAVRFFQTIDGSNGYNLKTSDYLDIFSFAANLLSRINMLNLDRCSSMKDKEQVKEVLAEQTARDSLSFREVLEERLDKIIDDIIDSSWMGKENVYNNVMSEVEKVLLGLVLRKTSYKRNKAAKVLGISRNTLREKIKVLSLCQ